MLYVIAKHFVRIPLVTWIKHESLQWVARWNYKIINAVGHIRTFTFCTIWFILATAHYLQCVPNYFPTFNVITIIGILMLRLFLLTLFTSLHLPLSSHSFYSSAASRVSPFFLLCDVFPNMFVLTSSLSWLSLLWFFLMHFLKISSLLPLSCCSPCPHF